jgi:DNA repair exonuclease SbcCD nuclease subunit
MNKETIRYLVLSDVHLGHPRNKTENIIHALDTFRENLNPELPLDIIFLAGDIFDNLLDFSSPESNLATIWAAGLMKYCGRLNIKLRVLKGTPSHDWDQSEIFNTLAKAAKFPVDMKYVNSLSIEHMDDLGLSVLYVPDEWRSDPEVTYDEVRGLLAQDQLDKVDIAIMHGNFGYQLPPQATKAPRHNEEKYLSIVKYFISIGHIHTSSVYSRILAQGSFDRLAHGEEEPKGGMLCTIHQNGHGEYFFIENKQAKIFKTINLRFNDVDAAIQQIERHTAKLPVDAYVRIRAKKDHPLIIGFDEVKKRFPLFHFTKITLEEEDDNRFSLIEDVKEQPDYIPITITKDNISTLLMDEIRTKYEFSVNQLRIAERNLLEVM